MTHPNDPGYSIEERVFQSSAMSSLSSTLDGAQLWRTKAGARHVLSLPAVRDLANDRALLERAGRLIGPAAVPFRATLFDKSSRANWLVAWHQDTALPLRNRVDDPRWGPWSVKASVLYAHAPASALETVVALRVSLDDSTESNGPLRVLPHSHVHGVLSDAEINRWANETVPVDCVTGSGGVVAIRPLTLHASSKSSNGSRRRVLHIEYAACTVFDNGPELALG
jgi:hypothetical protein